MHFRTVTPVILSGIVGLSVFTGACATKKHVREQIAPVNQHISEVEKKGQENTTAIGDLDRNVAQVNEKALEADRKAAEARQAADKANDAAGQAQSAANSASSLAQQSLNRSGQIEERINNLNNYKLMTTEKVYFRLNRADLTDEEKAKLDQTVQNLQNQKNYVIEVAGYTDTTGPRALNLDLSRRRAEAVVRYLTVEHNVPLRRIHDVGVGSDFPDAVNKTRADRQENRRVDIRVYTLDEAQASQSSQSSKSLSSSAPSR
jgi:outer membrane protein OmpA-like peptidoglycan-associated protein